MAFRDRGWATQGRGEGGTQRRGEGGTQGRGEGGTQGRGEPLGRSPSPPGRPARGTGRA